MRVLAQLLLRRFLPLFALFLFTEIHSQIHHAAQHPVQLDQAQSDAVDARTLLDLRIGAAFSRMQTLSIQRTVAELGESLISYGRAFSITWIWPLTAVFRSLPVSNPWICCLTVRAGQSFCSRTILVHIHGSQARRSRGRDSDRVQVEEAQAL